jgi:hypothetical protein
MRIGGPVRGQQRKSKQQVPTAETQKTKSRFDPDLGVVVGIQPDVIEGTRFGLRLQRVQNLEKPRTFVPLQFTIRGGSRGNPEEADRLANGQRQQHRGNGQARKVLGKGVVECRHEEECGQQCREPEDGDNDT